MPLPISDRYLESLNQLRLTHSIPFAFLIRWPLEIVSVVWKRRFHQLPLGMYTLYIIPLYTYTLLFNRLNYLFPSEWFAEAWDSEMA